MSPSTEAITNLSPDIPDDLSKALYSPLLAQMISCVPSLSISKTVKCSTRASPIESVRAEFRFLCHLVVYPLSVAPSHS